MVSRNEIYVVLEDGRGFLTLAKVGEKLIVESLYHRLDGFVKDSRHLLVSVYLLVIIALCGSHSLIMLGVKHYIGLSVAVFDNINHKVVNDFSVDCAYTRITEGGVGVNNLRALCVLSVLAEIGNNIADSYDAAFKR